MTEEKPISRQRKYQLLQRENGLCRNCPNKARGAVYCSKCRERNKERYLLVNTPKYCCNYCGIAGHNTRTCPDFRVTKEGKAVEKLKRRMKAELDYWSRDY